MEEYDDTYWSVLRDAERGVREQLTGGRRHLAEAELRSSGAAVVTRTTPPRRTERQPGQRGSSTSASPVSSASVEVARWVSVSSAASASTGSGTRATSGAQARGQLAPATVACTTPAGRRRRAEGALGPGPLRVQPPRHHREERPQRHRGVCRGVLEAGPGALPRCRGRARPAPPAAIRRRRAPAPGGRRGRGWGVAVAHLGEHAVGDHLGVAVDLHAEGDRVAQVDGPQCHRVQGRGLGGRRAAAPVAQRTTYDAQDVGRSLGDGPLQPGHRGPRRVRGRTRGAAAPARARPPRSRRRGRHGR